MVLGASVDRSADSVRSFAKERISYPVLLDTGGLIANKYKVKAIPQNFYIDRKGIIRHSETGFHGEAKMASEVEKIIGSEAPKSDK